MFLHRLAAARTGATVVAAALLLASLAFWSPPAAAQSEPTGQGSVDAAVIAQIAAESAESGEPVTVVLAGATSRQTLEIAGSIAAAVGEHGEPAGWTVVHKVTDIVANGPVIIIADGPGPGSEVTASTDAGLTTITFAGEPRELIEAARSLVATSNDIRSNVVVPTSWRLADLGEALGVISELASTPDATTMHLVTDQSVDARHELIVVGPDASARAGALGGVDAQPTLLGFAEDDAQVIAVSGPAPRVIPADGGFPLLAVLAALVMLTAIGFDFARRRLDLELLPATV